jgi:hypothetical protein
LGIDDASGGTWSFVAPAKFLGNKAAAYGAALSYDINISARDSVPWAWPDVELVGAGITLDRYLAAPTAGVWTHYDVPLAAGAWQKSGGVVATEAEMRAVLANLTYLSIRAEYLTGADQAYLDNVVMTPEPATLSLLALGGLGALLRRRRK